MSQNPIEDAIKKVVANSNEQTNTLKSISRQQTIQTAELAFVAANTAEMVSLQTRQVTLTEDLRKIAAGQLDEQRRTNTLLEQQLVETSLEKLERKRQLLLKQAAYAVGRDTAAAESFRTFPRFILMRQITAEVDSINLNPDELHEIQDKEYAHAALKRLQESTAKAESDLTESDTNKLQMFLRSLEATRSLPSTAEQKRSETVQREKELAELRDVLTDTQKKEYGAIKKMKKIIGKIIGGVFILLTIVAILAVAFPTDGEKRDLGVLVVAAFFGILGLFFFFAWGSPNKNRIKRLQDQIQGLDEKSKKLSVECQVINTQLEESRRVINGITSEYPELKKLALLA
jgi:hypothetical protein